MVSFHLFSDLLISFFLSFLSFCLFKLNPLFILLGGSGGGFFSNGTDKNADGGRGFLQGGVGGKGNALKADGGFGGGGGAYGGGGGGGYSGGGGGGMNKDSCGGGGGSFNSGKDQKNECCYQSDGPGQVTITLL